MQRVIRKIIKEMDKKKLRNVIKDIFKHTFKLKALDQSMKIFNGIIKTE